MKKTILFAIVCILSITGYSQDIKKIKITELEKTIKESKTPLVITFWATFCVPCVQEIPYFQESVNMHKKDSVKLLLVSLDLHEDYAKIRPFAVKRNLTAPILWLNETNADYFCPKIDSSWSGAIPATLFVNNKTGYRKFYEDQIKKERFEKEIMATLGKKD